MAEITPGDLARTALYSDPIETAVELVQWGADPERTAVWFRRVAEALDPEPS